MMRALKVLLIEDNEDDALLVERELRRGGYMPTCVRVQTAAEMSVSLDETWDLILADFSLPDFGAEAALQLLHDRQIDIPFIIVSGTIDEERAVAALRAGAEDFVTKARLARLLPSIDRALRERAQREMTRAADELSRRRGQQLDSLARNIPDLIAQMDQELRYTFVSPAFAEVSGRVPQDFVGRTNAELGLDARACAEWERAARAVLATGRLTMVEVHYPSAKGGMRWYESRIVPERDDRGELLTLLLIVRDVTAQRAAADELRQRAEQQSMVAELGQRALAGLSIPDLLDAAAETVQKGLHVDVVKIVEAEPALGELIVRAGIGLPEGAKGTMRVPGNAGSAAGLAIAGGEVLVIEDLDADSRVAAGLLLSLGIRSGMSVVIKGREAPWGVLGAHSRVPRSYTRNEIEFFRSVAHILAQAIERWRAESDLRISEERVRAIIESVSEGVVFVDRNGHLTYGNRRAESILGLHRSELVGRVYDDEGWQIRALDGGPFPVEELPFTRVMATGEPAMNIEHAIHHPDGARRLLSVSGAPVRAASGEIQGMVASVRDVTEAHSAETRLRFQATLLDAVGEAVIATDPDAIVTYWNRAATMLYGWGADEAIGQSIFDLIQTAESAELAREIVEGLRGTGRWSGELTLRRKDGSEFVAFLTNTTLVDENGVITAIVGSSTDVTRRRKLEAELRQAQKMEAVGRLAGGVAHDFNNILTAITGFAEFVLEGLDSESPLYPDVVEISRAAERASALTRQLLAFSRNNVVEMKVFEIAPVVSALAPMLRRLIGEDVALKVHCNADVGHVRGDPGLLEQVVVNLVVNAVDALNGGGTVEVDVSRCADPTDEDPTREGVVLRVTDNGTGIEEHVMPHIFEPFFTTKPSGKGTGLGLSTVHGIVTQTGGTIEVDSRRGHGTTFRVRLPRAIEAPAKPAREQHSAISGGWETVLVVEDDEAVRRMARRCLEKGGYNVIEAATPSAALEASAREQNIHVLLTDVVLPEMAGPRLARLMRDERPDLRVLLMSGYMPDDLAQRAAADAMHDATSLIRKPFSAQTLLEKVAETRSMARAS